MGVADRGSHDLDCHARGSGKSFEYLDKENFDHLVETEGCSEVGSSRQQRKYVPHCIEPSLGLDRLFLALLTSAYKEEQVRGGGLCICAFSVHEVAPGCM
jgi:glycyl-tRNA synthetase